MAAGMHLEEQPKASAHLVVVPHTHWDREWYQPFQQFRARLVRLLDHLLDTLEQTPAFQHFHLDGQTIVLEDYLEIRPQCRSRLRRLIQGGRIAVGPWYVLPDEFLVSGESIIRNLQIGHRLAAEFGTAQKIGYLPDQFGHIAQMPQILAGFDIDCAVVWRGVGADVTRTLFRWEGLDGSSAFTVYLPHSGYSNGRSLPEDADELRQRLAAVIAEQAPYRAISSLLVMNGTDHQEPQRRLPEVLATATPSIEGITYEIGPLAHFLDRARREHGELQTHRGELRSPLRAHLLPGVTSVRVRQKQRDFENVSRLERYAEPLAVWADLMTNGSGTGRLSDFTDWAWKMAVQNHPHDSICGCSVDQVHRDMEHRFDQVAMVAEQVTRQAFAAVAQHLDTSGAGSSSVLVVYNPNGEGMGPVGADVYADGDAPPAIEDSEGRQLPVHLQTAAREVLFAAELPPQEIRQQVMTIQSREFLGYLINDVAFHREGERLSVVLTMDRVLRGRIDVGALRRKWLAMLDDPTLRVVAVRAQTGAPARLTLVAPRLAAHGCTMFAVGRKPDGASADGTAELRARARAIENRHYKVVLQDDGTLRITDKETNLVLPRCNWFVDEGDRGDEYNFDPLQPPAVVGAPVSAPAGAVDAGNAVMAALTISQVYEVPRALETDRDTRSRELVAVPITTRVCLYAGLKRIDFETSVENAASDHRLRVHFQTPLAVTSAFMEQAFGTVERSLEREPGAAIERPTGTVPQKTFTCIQDGGRGVALFNRGIQEVEVERTADGTQIALTLVRAVGWLSRGDLRWRHGHAGPGLETPEAQSPGWHRFEYALTTYDGDWESADIVGRAHQFAYPPIATIAESHAGALPADASLFRCDNSNIVLSAVTHSRHAGAMLVRCYNSTSHPQTGMITLPAKGRVRAVNLLERPVTGTLRRARRGDVKLTLRPFEIVTLQIRSNPGA